MSELPTVELSREGRGDGSAQRCAEEVVVRRGVLLFIIVVSRRGGIQYAFYFDVATCEQIVASLGGSEWELRRKIAETEMPSA